MTPQAESRIRAAFAALADELIATFEAEGAGADEPDRLYTIPEAAERLGGIARSTIYREIAAGRLRSVRVASRRLIPSAALREYAEPAR